MTYIMDVNIMDLPHDMWTELYKHLSLEDINSICSTCSYLYNFIGGDNHLWDSLLINKYNKYLIKTDDNSRIRYIKNNILYCLDKRFSKFICKSIYSIYNTKIYSYRTPYFYMGTFEIRIYDDNIFEMLLYLDRIKIFKVEISDRSDFPVNFKYYNNIKSLNVSRNNLSTLSTKINNFNCLKTLNLDHNNLTKLSSEICNLTSLTNLSIKSNIINEISSDISKLVNLTTLDIYDNNIKVIPYELYHLVKLNELDLSYNKLTIIQPELTKLVNLKYIGTKP